MHCMLLFLVTLLKIGTLKTESIDFTRKNGRMDMMFPLSDGSKIKDAALQPAIKQGEGDSESREWNVIESKFEPDEPLRKLVGFHDGEEYDGADEYDFPEDQFKSIEQLDDVQSARFSNYLIKFLQRPGVWEAPLILIKDSQDAAEDRPFPLELDGLQSVSKRSRYYRRYPWKRQNSRSYNMDYDPYNPCNPSKHDVFQLLVALHDARQGNKSRVVNFCNRRRPASAVYTNIRFLGRRRK